MAKRRGLVHRIVSTVWEIIPFNNEGIKGRKEYKKLAYENIDRFIAVTQKAKDCLIKEGVRPEKISVINMGIDLKKFKPNPVKNEKRDINILCVARLVPEKGIEDLLLAFLDIKGKESKSKTYLRRLRTTKKRINWLQEYFCKITPLS